MALPFHVERAATAARRGRLRARSLWALILAGIGFSASFTGLVQYMRSGIISIRPGREPLTGDAAVESLIAVLLVSCGFLIYGLILRSRSRKDSIPGHRAD